VRKRTGTDVTDNKQQSQEIGGLKNEVYLGHKLWGSKKSSTNCSETGSAQSILVAMGVAADRMMGGSHRHATADLYQRTDAWANWIYTGSAYSVPAIRFPILGRDKEKRRKHVILSKRTVNDYWFEGK